MNLTFSGFIPALCTGSASHQQKKTAFAPPSPLPPMNEPSPAQAVDVVCAILMRDDRFLVAQRPEGKRLAGLWEFPGGKVEPEESPENALHRELMEELGCSVTVSLAGPPFLHAYDWGSIRLLPFICHLEGLSPEPQAHEHQALRWVFQKDLSLLNLAPADLPIVEWLNNLEQDELTKDLLPTS